MKPNAPLLTRRKWLRQTTLMASALPLAPFARTAAQPRPIFRAGAAVLQITPTKLPIRVAGGIGEHWVGAITDPLNARALVLDDGSTRLALVVVDNLFMDEPMLDQAKASAAKTTGIPVRQMMISATHTHSAPPVVGVHGSDPHLDYREFLIGRLTEAIIAANRQLQPARIGWTMGECAEFIHCRRWLMRPGTAFTIPHTDKPANRAQMNPGHDNANKICQTGPVDISLPLLAVQTADGRPLAALAARHGHYAGAPGISADKYGVFARELGTLLSADERFVGMLACGTLGDSNCIDFSRPARTFNYVTVGETLARAARTAWQSIEWHPWASLAAVESSLRLRVRMPSREEVAAAQAYLTKNVGDRPIKTWEENYARETVLLSRMPGTRRLPHQVLRIGDFAIATSPCEVFGSTGLKLRARSPFEMQMNIGLANGYAGYLAPPDEHALGGYTTWRARSSCLEEAAELKATEALLSLLRKAKNVG